MDAPPFAHDLGPWDFYPFQNERKSLKRQRFADIPDIRLNVIKLLQGVSENDIQDRCRQWHHRAMKPTASRCEHFEGDSSRYCTGTKIVFAQGHFVN
jgi:hypothetical protein